MPNQTKHSRGQNRGGSTSYGAPNQTQTRTSAGKGGGAHNAPAGPHRLLTPLAERQQQEDLRKKDEKREARRALSPFRVKTVVHTVKDKERKPLPLFLLITVFACSLLASYLIYYSVKLSEYQSTVLQLQNEVRDLTEQKTEAQLELDRKNDLLLIEEYALRYGMVRVDQLTRYYISVSGEDSVTVYPKN